MNNTYLSAGLGFLIFLFLVTTVKVNAADPLPVGQTSGWRLVFSDDFNGTSIDKTKWEDTWFGEGTTMNNVGTYSKNVTVSGGFAKLKLSSQTEGAMIHTGYQPGHFQVPVNGYVEARISFPGNGGDRDIYNWPAWWISGPSWPADGEHDIAEGLSGELTVNYHSNSGAHNQGAVPGTWGNAFHVYGVHRKSNSADVYWDGVKVKSYATDDSGIGEEIIVNAGTSGTPTVGDVSTIQVDYVRAWAADATGPACKEGDTNHDGIISLVDYQVWRNAFKAQ